ncbi:MAG: hypothetical protein BWY21_01278 [Parcubacteria group bacterium ADurb.Bin216]|nr:MAG: hypothetical protein BWY21_01278 [Parcubacteria group bacterium ADurb.Bin216]
MEKNEVVSTAIEMIDGLVIFMDEDYSKVPKVSQFRNNLLKYRDQIVSCGDSDKVNYLVRKMIFEIEQFNIWLKVDSIVKDLRKKGI